LIVVDLVHQFVFGFFDFFGLIFRVLELDYSFF